MKKIYLFSLLFVLTGNIYAQSELNAYKYIIIPKKYDFLSKENQYRLNTLTKYMFDQEGFTTVLRGEDYPDDLMSDPCLALTADIDDNSNLYKTKLNLILLDCHDNVVFTSVEGTSKIKQYDKTYIDALEKSFVSVKYLNYKYDPSIKGQASKKSEIQQVAVAEPVDNKIVASEITPIEEKAAITKTPTVEPESATKEMPEVKQEVKEPVIAVAAVPIAKEEHKTEPKEESKPESIIARNYENENISFFLIQQGDQLVAYVNESRNANYKKGELIGTFEKTSVPNFFRVSWKKKEQEIDETMAYFDEAGNLKIDIHRNGEIEVISFTEVKD